MVDHHRQTLAPTRPHAHTCCCRHLLSQVTAGAHKPQHPTQGHATSGDAWLLPEFAPFAVEARRQLNSVSGQRLLCCRCGVSLPPCWAATQDSGLTADLSAFVTPSPSSTFHRPAAHLSQCFYTFPWSYPLTLTSNTRTLLAELARLRACPSTSPCQHYQEPCARPAHSGSQRRTPKFGALSAYLPLRQRLHTLPLRSGSAALLKAPGSYHIH